MDGGIKQYKVNILERSNISNNGSEVLGLLSKRGLSGMSSGSSIHRPKSGMDAPAEDDQSSPENIPVSPLAHLATKALSSHTRKEVFESTTEEANDNIQHQPRASGFEIPSIQEADSTERRSSDDDRFLSMLQESHE